jgi:hypothetical protein
MSKDQKEICLYCKWWKMHDLYSDIEPDEDGIFYPPGERRGGECRVSPPAAVLSPGRPVEGRWPEVFGGDWCGEFTGRPDDHASDTTFEHIGDAAARVIGRIKPGDAA